MTALFRERNGRYQTGACCNGKRSRIYNEWQNMKRRCFNPKHKSWHRYGGRGITICEEWKIFKNFMEWAFANGYKDDLSLDRIDNNGNYEPSNCQWITLSKNSQKKCRTILNYQKAVEIRKRKKEKSYDLAKEYGVSQSTIKMIRCNYIWKESTENAKP